MNIISRIVPKSNIMNAKQYFNVEIIRGIPLPKLAKNWNNKHYLHSIKLFFMHCQYTDVIKCLPPIVHHLVRNMSAVFSSNW